MLPEMYLNNPKSDTLRFGGRTWFTFNAKSGPKLGVKV
jgi:hypothetical protein